MHVMGCGYMSKNKVEVVIGGVIYSLQGEESQEHIQRVARMINEKTSQIQSKYSKQHMNPSKMNMLVTLNLADEYVKAQYELERYGAELAKGNEENSMLEERIRQLTIELAEARQQLMQHEQSKKKEHTNRGR